MQKNWKGYFRCIFVYPTWNFVRGHLSCRHRICIIKVGCLIHKASYDVCKQLTPKFQESLFHTPGNMVQIRAVHRVHRSWRIAVGKNAHRSSGKFYWYIIIDIIVVRFHAIYETSDFLYMTLSICGDNLTIKVNANGPLLTISLY